MKTGDDDKASTQRISQIAKNRMRNKSEGAKMRKMSRQKIVITTIQQVF